MTLVRTLVWFVLLVVAMTLAVWLVERPGVVTVQWHGWRLDTSVGVVLIVIVVLCVLAALLYALWRWLAGAPSTVFDIWGESRRRKGYRALTQGMVAVAAGDAAEAQRCARLAEKLLEEPPLTRLLSAQAAQLAGDRDAAQRYFAAMLDDPQMAFLGLRGLMMQSLKDGNSSKALAYAEQAFQRRPDTPWVVRSLFDMQAQAGKWSAAQETLQVGLKRKIVDPERGRTLSALLLVERSRAAERGGADQDAVDHAKAALALAPEREPVAYRYAELLIKRGDGRKAMKAIERAWPVSPHPDLAQLYLAAAGEKDALKRVQALGRLTAANPDDLDSRIALARECLEARLWGEARRHLVAAGAERPDAPTRLCRLMADLEEQEYGDGEKVRQWLARAADSPGDRQWRCRSCGAVHDRWLAVCDSCAAFGTTEWQMPPPSSHAVAAAAATSTLRLRPEQEVLPPDPSAEAKAPAS
ncbi:heme biosynthesis protein HemY [Vineibacter terrae]|uniref:heme biosynthesis protein HemY n=1 Tax=Vineibacter terrae TaxID=2586908 RepID=UPI002E303614|nr:heme biosynthesis HemY N-terminal domain-containing protein [Vineibacter terrae]HEX2887513.1 heme biosynthesis HemY N-terminal domain-containing protein [Vineibacter terrae]